MVSWLHDDIKRQIVSAIMSEQDFIPTTSPFKTGVLGKCPKCQQGHIFKGWLAIAPHCEVCNLDFSYADTADGPAFFAMSIVSPFSVGLALWLALGADMPVWLSILITLLFTIAASMLVLRPLKGWMVSSKYHYVVLKGKR